jgi:predicted nuclease of predicted toxin-antitoxin system
MVSKRTGNFAGYSMKILIDMSLSCRWVEFFSDNGFESIHWSCVGNISAPDEEIMNYAIANDFLVFTNDLDFATILAMTNNCKPSVIQLRSQDVRMNTMKDVVFDAINKSQEMLEKGALATIEPKRTRVRILPLRDE